MKGMHTAERVSFSDLSDNFVFQRSLLAYIEAGKLVHGKVLEIGTGTGYGVEHIAPKADEFITIDKHQSGNYIDKEKFPNVEFKQQTIPPLTGFPDNYFDFVVSFQVIEHIKKDKDLVAEVHRVLKPGGCFILTTPNKKASLTRNPWHVREYTVGELKNVLKGPFESVECNGVFGNAKAMEYYEENKLSVRRITRFDILNLQYNLPRVFLQIPYDILNRINRRKLMNNNNELLRSITTADFHIAPATDTCFDLFYIAKK